MSSDPESEVLRDLRTTHVAPSTARLTALAFVLLVFSVPLAGLRHGRFAGESPRERLASAFGYEAIRDELSGGFAVPVQRQLAMRLDFGNTLVALGRDGWFYYTPALDLIGGPPMLDPDWLATRRRHARLSGAKRSDPDARPAILEFARACARAGAALVLVPVPDKAMLQPSGLSSRWRRDPALPLPTNPDWKRWVGELRGTGVAVLDLMSSLSGSEQSRFLKRDSHWTPGWMEAVAADVAVLARATVALGTPPSPFSCTVSPQTTCSHGDLAELLGRAGRELHAPESVEIHRVEIPELGAPGAPRPDVVLLGDSLTQVFEVETYGWGSSAGFGRHLMRRLGRPIDIIAGPGCGPVKARKQLAARTAPLRGVKLVIWQFAMRELVLADWPLVEIPK